MTMPPKWEYTTIAATLNFDAAAEPLDTAFLVSNRHWARLINDSCNNVQAGGWELMSHAITPALGSRALFTAVLRRTALAHRN